MNGRRLWMSLALLVAVLATGCSSNPYAQWKEVDVVYASQVPIYPGSVMEDAMGGNYYGESLDEHVSETITYFFKMDPESRDKVVAYYEKELTGATKTTTEDGDVRFELVPKGAESGESVYVSIGKDRLMIGEETKPGKHKAS